LEDIVDPKKPYTMIEFLWEKNVATASNVDLITWWRSCGFHLKTKITYRDGEASSEEISPMAIRMAFYYLQVGCAAALIYPWWRRLDGYVEALNRAEARGQEMLPWLLMKMHAEWSLPEPDAFTKEHYRSRLAGLLQIPAIEHMSIGDVLDMFGEDTETMPISRYASIVGCLSWKDQETVAKARAWYVSALKALRGRKPGVSPVLPPILPGVPSPSPSPPWPVTTESLQ